MPSFHGRKKSSSSGDRSPKGIGCLSGIFHLLHGRILGRKRLTQAGKADKNCSHAEQQFREIVATHFTGNAQKQKTGSQQLEPKSKAAFPADLQIPCDDPPSTMLPPEMKQQALQPPTFQPGKLSQCAGVVARLMGLEDLPVSTVRQPDLAENASEKRRRILGALEKCNEDVRALKRIINAVQAAEKDGCKLAVPGLVACTDARVGTVRRRRTSREGRREKCLPLNSTISSSHHEWRWPDQELNYEEPSPLSVLDGCAFFQYQENKSTTKEWHKNDKEKDQDVNDIFSRSIPKKESYKYHRLITDAYAKPFEGARNEAIFGPAKTSYYIGVTQEVAKMVLKECAMKESCECERIVLALESHIFGSLVEEAISELGFECKPSLAFFRCRKRLFF